jgi:hypothetical protein
MGTALHFRTIRLQSRVQQGSEQGPQAGPHAGVDARPPGLRLLPLPRAAALKTPHPRTTCEEASAGKLADGYNVLSTLTHGVTEAYRLNFSMYNPVSILSVPIQTVH